MPAPIPVVAPIPEYTDLPVGGTVSLSGSGGLAGASYQWTLIEQPDGSNAQLQNANTTSPTLVSVDTRGTYIVFLKITDSGGASHAYPYPVQATSAPYGFTVPVTTAFGVVRVKEESGLIKPGRGEYGWFEKGLWPLIDKVGTGLTFEFYDIPTHTLTADAIVPFSDTATVDFNSLIVTDAEAATYVSSEIGSINVLSDLTLEGTDLYLAGGELKTDTIASYSGGDISVDDPLRMAQLYVDTVSVNTVGGDIAVTNRVRIAQLASPTALSMSVSADDDLTLNAVDNIVLNATGTDGDITLNATDDIVLNAAGTDGDITLNATDDIVLNAYSAAEVNGTTSAALYASSPSAGVVTVYGKKNVAGTDSVIIRADARIKLQPVTDTYSDKPIRAPGLIGCVTKTAEDDTVLVPDPANPYYPLFAAPFTFTRQNLGAQLSVDAHVRCTMDKNQSPVVRVVRETATAGVVELVSVTLPSHNSDNINLHAHFYIDTRICDKGAFLTHIRVDISTYLGVLSSTVHKFMTESMTVADRAQVKFDLQLDRSATTYKAFAAQATASLYAAHTEDVI
jgi:hypothetical protein